MDENLKQVEDTDGVETNDHNEIAKAPEAVMVPETVITPTAVTTPDATTTTDTDISEVSEAAIAPAVAAPPPETQPEAPAATSLESANPVASTKKRLSKKLKIISAIVVSVVVLAAGAAAYFVTQNGDQPTNSTPQTTDDIGVTDNASSVPADNTKTEPELPKATYHITSWDYQTASIDTRIKLSAKITSYGYYTIAKLDNGATLTKLSTGPTNDTQVVSENVYFIITSSKVLLASNISQSSDKSAYGVDEVEATIPEFNPTAAISYSGQTFSSRDTYGSDQGISGYGNEYTVTLLTTTDLGKFYQITKVVSGADGYMLRAYDLETPDARTHRYKLDSAKISNDDATLKVTWSDSNNKAAVFVNPLHGCGQGYFDSDTILDIEPDLSSAVKVATVGASGKPVYRLTTTSFVKSMYDEYSSGRTTDKISIDDFQTKLTHVVFQDGFGKWILLQNSNYGPNGECGKPVVYLYPTKTTTVNVAVGADVTVSIPTYPVGGWKKVVAQPNGALSYGGRAYDSLFWEGKGHGAYPDTSLLGTVVSQSKLLGTVHQQLATQGLNAKETSDFMAFWTGKLPKTPYVKLTWLTTAQMNELAPLYISPKPTTVIRVFLDAKGLSEPITVLPQALNTSARQGFTVVEWGGLMSAASH